MAEVLAGWLTSAVVGIAKDKLASVIAQQANLLLNFGDDLDDMIAVLESISAALQDAERRSVRERLVQLWLKRLKNAALDISDMIEEFQETSEEQLIAKMPRVLSCLPIAKKKIAMAKRMKGIREELRKINEQFRNFKFTPGANGTFVEQHSDCRETSSLSPEEPIGRSGEKQEIIKLLSSAGSNNDGTVIVTIYGFGGMGKTTLAQLLYNDAQFKKRYDHTIWVYVSQDFSLKKIGSSIISQLSMEGGQQNRDALHMINQCLDNLLHGKKVLIVLDDLWEEKDNELGLLRRMLHVGKRGSLVNVIVTTRKEDIANKFSTTTAFKLQPLKDDTCWEIIKRSSKFEHKDNKERLERIGLDIAKKCGGVPLAAQALGYMLQSKDLPGWSEINNNEIWNESSEDDGVLLSLKLSYERMPPQLRICFSYCAIFPKGHKIAEDDLIIQWIALGFIKPSNGKEYIRQLLGMSFLEVSKLPSATSQEHIMQYTMHDLVHDLAVLTMSDELTVFYAAQKSNTTHGHKYCHYALVTKYDQTVKLSNILPLKLRALHFSDIGKLDLISGAFKFAKCLRILDFSGCSSILLPASVGQLKQLKYLVAPRIQNEYLPDYITELPKLQYLNLNGSAHISSLPESTGKLTECLKYLCLSGCCGISKLPESYGDLKWLVHLDMSGCSRIRKLPDSLGNLTNLQHLMLSKCFSLEVIPESLCNLTQILYLNLSFCNYIARLPEAIGNLVNLEYLNISYCGVKALPESFKMLHNLLHLNLEKTSIEKGLPGALSSLTTLQYLQMSYLMSDNLEKEEQPVAMRNLTNLKVLNLGGSLCGLFGDEKNDGYLDFIGSLTNLESLDLSLNAKLRYLPESIGNLKRLQKLNLMHCEGLQSIPESIRCATGLKSICLTGCSDELIDQATIMLHSLTLPLFKVSDRKSLHQLVIEKVDELHIYCLENVSSLEEAQGLNLWTKEHILKLTLEWTMIPAETSFSGQHLEHKDLLGHLVPPKSLLSLTLQGYSSPSFPSWLMDISHHLPNITDITLSILTTCTNLPPLGQLPYLERLWLAAAPNIQKIDSSICGGKRAFPRLADFTVYHMERLKEWDTTFLGEDGVEKFMFPMLDAFYVINCPRLRLKPCPPKCRQYMIAVSDQVISSLEELETNSPRSSSNETTSLMIIYCQSNRFRLFHHFPALQSLTFTKCPNLMSMPDGIQQLSSLMSLTLEECDNISALPEWLSEMSSLKRLVIKGCKSIKSLPPCIQQLTNLQELDIRENQDLQQWCESVENKVKLAHIDDISYGYL